MGAHVQQNPSTPGREDNFYMHSCSFRSGQRTKGRCEKFVNWLNYSCPNRHLKLQTPGGSAVYRFLCSSRLFLFNQRLPNQPPVYRSPLLCWREGSLSPQPVVFLLPQLHVSLHHLQDVLGLVVRQGRQVQPPAHGSWPRHAELLVRGGGGLGRQGRGGAPLIWGPGLGQP